MRQRRGLRRRRQWNKYHNHTFRITLDASGHLMPRVLVLYLQAGRVLSQFIVLLQQGEVTSRLVLSPHPLWLLLRQRTCAWRTARQLRLCVKITLQIVRHVELVSSRL